MLLWLTPCCKPMICNMLEIQNQIRRHKNKTTANYCALHLTYTKCCDDFKVCKEKNPSVHVLHLYISGCVHLYKGNFKAQAFFPDAQQSKSWYPLTRRECCEQDQIRVISAFDISRQSVSTIRCVQSFPLTRGFSWRLLAKTLLAPSVSPGLTCSLCWDSDWGMWGPVLTQVVLLFAAHIISGIQM